MLNIDDELKQAMRSGDKEALSVLRMVKSSLVNARIAAGQDLSEADVIRVLKKESKARADAAALYESAGREELAAKELNEQKIIEKYLPASMDDAAIGRLVDEVKAELGDDFTQRNFGRIMQQVLARAKGQADGGDVSRIVKAKLEA